MTEEWRPVVGFEGRYEVSSEGRVRSLERKVRICHGAFRVMSGRVLKQGVTVGYPCVVLGRGRTKMVHSLVAAAFLGPRPAGYDVMHLDGSRTNNCLANLRYGTRSENIKQAFWDGRRKVTPEMLDLVVGKLAIGVTGAEISRLFGISQSHVSSIKHGHRYAR